MSRLPFELFLALRYLRPKRTFVSVITLISIIGVTLGVAVLIIVISVMTGFDRQLREKILGFQAHLKISMTRSNMRDYQRVMRVVASNSDVKGVAPFVLGPVLLEAKTTEGDTRVLAPYVRGIDPNLETNVTVLPKSILPGGKFDVKGNGLLVGLGVATALRLEVGDVVNIYSTTSIEKMIKQRDKADTEAYLPTEYRVKGIFDVGYYEYNAWIICSLGNAQDMYGLEDAVHGLLVILHDPFEASRLAGKLQKSLGDNFTISTWFEDNAAILNALAVEKHVMFYLLFFIMIVAAFGIMSALITFAVQKTREIGMLKALGSTSEQILWLFLSQSLIVGVIGVLTGYGLGMLALAYRNEFLHFMNRAFRFELFPASIYGFADLPAMIVTGDIVLICGSALFICIMAGVLPAWNAGRLKPVEALRHE